MTRKIFLAGHRGLVGSALVRRYQRDPAYEILVRRRQELDLTDPVAVDVFFRDERPAHVILAAGKVGGILANSQQPVDFLLDNLQIQNNVLKASHQYGVEKFLFLGSSCIYPKLAPQPIKEEYLLDGKLEPTNEPYAVAKIAGIKLAQAYRKQYGCHNIAAMPTNLYGPNDNFSLQNSHVLPALMRKLHEAKVEGRPTVTLWGDGSPRREFLHVDDLADACYVLMERYDEDEIINIGCGEDQTIRELAETMKRVVGFAGEIVWDTSKPSGTPRKWLDVARIRKLGWRPTVPLEVGIRETYAWYCESLAGTTAMRM